MASATAVAAAMAATTVAASRKHVELSLELKRKLIQEHEHGVPFTLLGKKYHIATSTAANIWRKKDFFLRSRMSGSRKRCNDRSKYKIVNQVTALFVKSMLERNHKIDGEVIKRFARTAAAQCNFKDFHGSNGWLDSFKKRENVCWVRRRGERSSIEAATSNNSSQQTASSNNNNCRQTDSPNLSTAAAAAAVAATAGPHDHHHHHHNHARIHDNNSGSQPQHSQHSHHHFDLHHDNHLEVNRQEDHNHHHNHYHHNHNNNNNNHLENTSPSSGGSSHCCWDNDTCARCTVAAAAAAVAALNSSDSLHERDHEIEDWFHGIPFLCQFFEEYQSMHQQQMVVMDNPSQVSGGSASGARTGSASAMTNGACGLSANAASLQLQVVGQCTTSATGTNSNSSCASSTASNNSFQHHHHHQQQQPQQQRLQASMSSDICASHLLSAPIQSQETSIGGQTPMQQQQQQQQEQHSTSSSFRSSASLADIQSVCGGNSGGGLQTARLTQQQAGELQRTISSDMLETMGQHQITKSEQYAMSEQLNYDETSKAFQDNSRQGQHMDFRIARASGGGNESATNGDHTMDTSYTEEIPEGRGQERQMSMQSNGSSNHLMELLISAKSEPSNGAAGDVCCDSSQRMANNSNGTNGNGNGNGNECHRGQCSLPGQHSAAMVGTDYNSDDLDFYLPQANAGRYIAQDAQSDDLLYHDEISDNNDACCSDHYPDQQSVDGNGGRRPSRELATCHQHDYRTAELVAGGRGLSDGAANSGQLESQLGACYMDEYEYENISTIRHYPLPMSQLSVVPATFSLITTTAPATAAAVAAAAADSGEHQNAGETFRRDSSAGSLLQQQQQQQQQQHAASSCRQQQQQQVGAFVSMPSASPNGDDGSAQISAQTANNYPQGQQQQEQQQQQQTATNQQQEQQAAMAEYSSLIGFHDHEQGGVVEHADHEEHNLLHNALMRSPEKLKLIDSIITLLNYASNYNQKMLAPLSEIKRWIERDLEVVLSDTTHSIQNQQQCCGAQGSAPSRQHHNHAHHQHQQRELQLAARQRQRQQQQHHHHQQQPSEQQSQIHAAASVAVAPTSTTSGVVAMTNCQEQHQNATAPTAAQCTEMLVGGEVGDC